MKIVVVSDSHRRHENLSIVKNENRDADIFIHCGDLETNIDNLDEFIAVKGNNDYFNNLPEQRLITCEEVRILIIHSHQFSYRNRLVELIKLGKTNNCQIICFGHTHSPYLAKHEGIWLVNPGSLMYNRDGSPLAYVVLEINKGEIKSLQVKDLEEERGYR